jgi:hypothetical protein
MQVVLAARGPAEGRAEVSTCNEKDNEKALVVANFNLAISLNSFWSK